MKPKRQRRAGHARLGPFALVLLGIIGLAGCSAGPRVVSAPDSTSVTTGRSTDHPTSTTVGGVATTVGGVATTVAGVTTTAPGPAVTPAAVGSTITLEGTRHRVAVTLTALADPAPPEQYVAPDPGLRLVAVQLRLVNVGTSVYRDSPSNGAKLIDAANQQFASTVMGSSVGPRLGSPTIAAGDTRLGWVTFQVPEAASPVRFTLALDSGFASQTGDWLLTEGAPGDASPPVLPASAGPGTAITLAGNDGEKVEVTLAAVADPAPDGQLIHPGEGKRFAAVQVRLRNVGTRTYADSPSNGMALVDSKGQQWPPTIAESAAGPGFAGGSVTLAPGDERVGWVTFEAAADASIAKLTMALSSGFADVVGEWRLA